MKKTLNILAYAKLQALICGLIGLTAGFTYAFGGLFVDTLVTLGLASSEFWETPGLSYGTVLAMGALPGMSLYGIVIGFVTGGIGAYLYNLSLRWWKGIPLNINA